MAKICIVITYFERQNQLNKTLESFKQYNPEDFFLVVVDDGSPEDIILPELLFEVTVLKMYNKTWTQGDPAYNTGFKHALLKNPDIIIIQNAECCHQGDILNYAKRVTDDSYLTFGCYSQGKGEEPGSVLNNRKPSFDGDSAWYNHPVYNPTAYHFCSAITAKNLIKLNGFDERLSFGAGYDDDDFLNRVRLLGLKIEITDSPIVIHQWHEHNPYTGNEEELLEKNRNIYQELLKGTNYKAEHIVTDNL